MPVSICFTAHRNLSRGAGYFRCAFQVNPPHYMKRYRGAEHGLTEEQYIDQLIAKCVELGIKVMAVTDHNHVGTIDAIRTKCEEKGIVVFPGFEVSSSEGVHVLCVYPPETTVASLSRFLGEFGIRDTGTQSDLSNRTLIDLIDTVESQGGIAIAAHITHNSGLLNHLHGQARANAWKHPGLLASQIPGRVEDVPHDKRNIVLNKDAEYKRTHSTSDIYAMAFVNANDVALPADLEHPGATTFIKMCVPTVGGLRQAFLDPDSRVRLNSDPVPNEHTEFVAISWLSGFLGDATIHFNENLNVLIGGRGTGKSTVVESIRFVLGLEPIGEDAKKSHHGIIKSVLGNGTKVSMLVRLYSPAMREYLIERSIPGEPIVKDEAGNLLNISPRQLLPNAEVYGQHEISEIAKSPQRCTELLDRFVKHDSKLPEQKKKAKEVLEKSRANLTALRLELRQKEQELEKLPSLEELLKTFKEAGLDEKLKDRSHLVKEQGILNAIKARVGSFRSPIEGLEKLLAAKGAVALEDQIEGIPNKAQLADAVKVLNDLELAIENTINMLSATVDSSLAQLGTVEAAWKVLFDKGDEKYQAILRELKKTGKDGAQYIFVQEQIEKLKPVQQRRDAILQEIEEVEVARVEQVREWNRLKKREFETLEKAAKKINKRLENKVRIRVSAEGNRDPLISLLRDNHPGRLSETLDILAARPALALDDLVHAFRAGRDRLAKDYLIPLAQAEKLASSPPELCMKIEELDLKATTTIELNVASDENPAEWKTLDDLSTGQKATAILLLLLMESDSPLVVDQPEDDLDNRFITEGIVPKMREEKRQRQFVFATHNANIPVLGDAELIVGMMPTSSAAPGSLRISEEFMGAIDDPKVRQLVEEVLEGGREAFEVRRRKYRF